MFKFDEPSMLHGDNFSHRWHHKSKQRRQKAWDDGVAPGVMRYATPNKRVRYLPGIGKQVPR